MAMSPAPADFAPLLFAGDCTAALDAAVELGFDAVEMSVRDPADPAVVSCDQGARKRNLRVSAVATGQSYYSDGWSLTDESQTLLERRMRQVIDLAAHWEALVVIGGVRGTLTGSDAQRVDQYRRAVETVRRLTDYAHPRQVSLVVEPINRYETNFINTIDEGMGFIREVGSANLGILADTFHMNIEEVNMAESLRSAGERILHVQFTDSNRRAPGQGHIDFAPLMAVLREVGYEGYLSIECLPLPDSRTAARQAIEYFRTLSEDGRSTEIPPRSPIPTVLRSGVPDA